MSTDIFGSAPDWDGEVPPVCTCTPNTRCRRCHPMPPMEFPRAPKETTQERLDSAAETLADLDAAMHSIWLHTNWHWQTSRMATPEREAAAAAVRRHSVVLGGGDQEDAVPLASLRWWDDTTQRGSHNG